jgi:hypothetical protein
LLIKKNIFHTEHIWTCMAYPQIKFCKSASHGTLVIANKTTDKCRIFVTASLFLQTLQKKKYIISESDSEWRYFCSLLSISCICRCFYYHCGFFFYNISKMSLYLFDIFSSTLIMYCTCLKYHKNYVTFFGCNIAFDVAAESTCSAFNRGF